MLSSELSEQYKINWESKGESEVTIHNKAVFTSFSKKTILKIQKKPPETRFILNFVYIRIKTNVRGTNSYIVIKPQLQVIKLF